LCWRDNDMGVVAERVGPAASVGVLQYIGPIHLVVQQIEPIPGFSLRFGMQRALQLLNTCRSCQVSQSPLLAASRVRLEPGRLSSTGVTRLRRSYAPLRHPARPGSIPRGMPVDRAHGRFTGLPVLPLPASFVPAVVTTPAQPAGVYFALFPVDVSLPRIPAGSACALPFSRPAQRSLALRPARSPNPLKDPLHRRLQSLRFLHDCSDCFRLERQLPGGIRTHWKTAPFHGALKFPG